MDEEVKQEVTPVDEPAPRRGRRKKKEEPKEGKALKGWALFFFIISCIMTGIVAASIALPFFITLFGIVSVICWLAVVAIVTIFTIGMIWLVDGVKEFNAGWMAFNTKLFESSSVIAETAAKAIPVLSIIGGSIVAITWLFMIIGMATDKNRKKFYLAMIITLGVLTLIYITIAIITIVMHQNVPELLGSSSSSIR